MIDLLVKTDDPIARSKKRETDAEIGISTNYLLLLIGFAFALDELGIDFIYTPPLPLVLSSARESKWVEVVYETCQAKVFSAKKTTAAVTWVVAIMLAALTEFEVPPFRFLKTVDCRVDPEKKSVLPLYVVLGEFNIAEDKAVMLIKTNLDDMNPQLLSHAINQLFEAGALDIYQVPVYMKKNRLGTQLSLVVRQRDEARLANLILKETTTLGVNVHSLDHRFNAETRMVEVETKFGKIPVKQKFIEGILAQSKPEYEVMAKIASEAQVSMDELNNESVSQLMIKPK